MSEDFSNFPTYEQAKQSIERLKKMNFPQFEDFSNVKEYLNEVEQILFTEFEILPNVFKFFKHKDFTLQMFRARELSTFTNVNLFTEHSYTPISLTGFGRCNFPEYPVFYCSNSPTTALIEVIRDEEYKGRKFCISKWQLNDVDGKLAFQTFLNTKLDKNNPFQYLRDLELEKMGQPFEDKLDEERKKGLAELLKYFHNLFMEDDSYALSASMAHRSLYANHNMSTDILMYPSMQTKFKGVNMAIHPNFVDNMMRTQRFYILEIIEYNLEENDIRLTFLSYGYIKKNAIIWNPASPDDERFQKYLSEDFQKEV